MLTPISARGEDSQYVAFLPIFSEPESILGEDKLKRLQPYILHVIEHTYDQKLIMLAKERFKILTLPDSNAAAFTIDTDSKEECTSLLSLIQDLCHRHITEHLIVPQFTRKHLPYIHHRVMEFEVTNNLMLVKYVTLGERNHFDAAMANLVDAYPEVSFSG